MFKEFREFAVKGNVIDMAVGIIIGGAFGTIVKSLVSDVIMPPVGLLLGGVDFSNLFLVLGDGSYESLGAAEEAGVATLNYGVFIDNCISFLIVAFAVFALVKSFNALRRQEEAAPAAPPEPSAEEKLLTEIRDLLKQRS